jgi:hypothetical protein
VARATLPVRLPASRHFPAHLQKSRKSFPCHTSENRARKSFPCHTSRKRVCKSFRCHTFSKFKSKVPLPYSPLTSHYSRFPLTPLDSILTQTPLRNSFRMNTYRKTGRGWQLMVNQLAPQADPVRLKFRIHADANTRSQVP